MLDVPNAGRKLVTLPKRLEWNPKFQSLLKELDAVKPVIICGDMNVAHQEIGKKSEKNEVLNYLQICLTIHRHCQPETKQKECRFYSGRKRWIY